MDKDYNLITNMNKILLNMNQKMINLPVLKQNIEYIYDLLYEPVPKNFPHKYNCLSCIFGAFLGDSIGSCCEFSPESPSNHLNIFRYEHGILLLVKSLMIVKWQCQQLLLILIHLMKNLKR